MSAGVAVGMVSTFGAQAEEAAWIQQLKAGTEQAYAELLAQFQQPIYSLLARTVQNQADAADLTQEVFLKVFRGIHSFNGEASLRTWIYRIALHEVSNSRRWWCRHQSREIPMEMPIESDSNNLCLKDTLIDPASSPYQDAETAELRAQVEAALRRVAEPFRTALVLRDIEGFSYEEIVEITGTTMGTIKSRILRGRNSLKQELASFAAARKSIQITNRSAQQPLLGNTMRQGATL